MTKEKTQIKIVKIKECVPNSWNPNEMNARQFSSLKKALTKYGQTKPIQVGVWPNMKVKDGYVIVGGYHTWKVLGELGSTEIEANVHDFKSEDEAKLYGLTDNIHGSNQQLKLGKLAYELTQNGYSIKEIASNLGEEDVNIKDALDLVKDEIEKKMIELKKAERENFIALNFIVDKDPKKSADDFIAAVTAFAKTKGVKVAKAVKDINSLRETIALISFNVTNPQKNVVDEALSTMTKTDKMTESEAIAEICSRFLLTPTDTK
jgi:ParB-like chromosome segregation protein Spo0J